MSWQFIWIATGVLVVVGLVWLISRAITKGQKLPMPTTTPYDDQDAPPADSDRTAASSSH